MSSVWLRGWSSGAVYIWSVCGPLEVLFPSGLELYTEIGGIRPSPVVTRLGPGIELQWDVAGVDHFQYFQSLLFCHGECSQGRVPLGLLDLGFGAPADGAGFCEYVQCVFQWDVHHYFLPVVAAGPPLGDVPFLLRPVRTGLGSDRFGVGLWLGAACGLGTCGGLCVLLFGAAGLEALFGAAAGVGGFRQDEAEFEVTTYRPFLR